ncbi:MJ1255/VC2487 family glycosyltransferase [Microbulbifer sp. GL-2]|uniref:MJ1255/VC2487 family glycosyltransferase n=1 Tax=Microbulbifer sp. GL-2 TaxID=2591606 RepID=UPI0011656E54|nr:MJ1255/VC2487 family glycosyltransferase [Microbulbifer sp. GL-2]BBM02696.1 glycosyl transferase [Microbulbifer sp. GL-2]
MKILYGVQATGNGHIARSRTLAKALQRFPELEIQWLFSGRPKEKLFDMELFGDYWWRRGLTFVHREGKLRGLETIQKLGFLRFRKEVSELPIDEFDLIISDYEPVTAWAAKIRKKPSVGIGHQYAFLYSIPIPKFNWVVHSILRFFAPTQKSLGLHWHHFGNPILPPIVPPQKGPDKDTQDHILVYLPFEHPAPMLEELSKVDEQFIVYGVPENLPTAANIIIKAPSTIGFQRDLANSRAVICNSGFELLAETLALGKPILSRPLASQFEQVANAKALKQLGLAKIVQRIDAKTVGKWLNNLPQPLCIQWPNVAETIANWIASGCKQPPSELADALWRKVVPRPTDNRPHIYQGAPE